MNIKSVRAPLQLKQGGEPGSVTAVFSTFDVVDSDDDIVLASAFTHGQAVPMTWAHRWDMPVGKGQILVEETQAVFDGAFFIDTDTGLEAYRTVKAMGALQEWSWGFRVLDAVYEERDQKYIRIIKRAEVFEVSPVLVGAGVGTYTRDIKSGMPYADQADAVLAAVRDLAERSKALAALRATDGRSLSDAHRKRLQDTMEALEAVGAEIQALLKAAEPAPPVNVQQLYVEFQRTVATLNGVAI